MFFTSDTHFHHSNIIKYCGRPFSSSEEMDEVLISNWNKTVGKKDIVYHLGDFAFLKGENSQKAFYSLKDRLNGNIVFIKGNHDHYPPTLRWFDLFELKINKQHIVMCHYPMMTWNKAHYGSFHLFGHVHGSFQDKDFLLTKRTIESASV